MVGKLPKHATVKIHRWSHPKPTHIYRIPRRGRGSVVTSLRQLSDVTSWCEEFHQLIQKLPRCERWGKVCSTDAIVTGGILPAFSVLLSSFFYPSTVLSFLPAFIPRPSLPSFFPPPLIPFFPLAQCIAPL